jgi:hypothetical protein
MGNVDAYIENLQYDIISGDVTLEWGNTHSFYEERYDAYASAYNNIEGQDLDNPSSNPNPGQQADASVSTAETHTGDDNGKFYAWGNASGNHTYTYSQSYGFYTYYHYFTITGEGTVAFTADWYIDQYLETELIGDEAYIHTNIELQVRDSSTGQFVGDDVRQQVYAAVYDGDNYAYNDFGTLTNQVLLPEGEYHLLVSPFNNLYTERTSTAPPPIPEPTTMLLLGSGIIGLAGFRRKFRNK